MKWMGRFARPAMLAVVALVLGSFALQGCSLLKKKDDTPDIEIDDTGDSGDSTPAPTANVQVSYKLKNDSLERTTVIKFFSAEIIQNLQHDSTHQESLVRFDGGVPIWEFKADRSTLGSLTGVGKTSYSLKNVDYGKVPQHFTQVIPDEGPPEPLDRGAFYVFEITRSSGVISYQAVKVEGDGSLVAYNAQPRAGNSYLLCCNLDQAFTEPVVLPDSSQAVEQAADQVDQNSQVPPSPAGPAPDGQGAAEGPDADSGSLPSPPSGPVNLMGGGGGGGAFGGSLNPANTPRGDPALGP
jgi:hypothetical protein